MILWGLLAALLIAGAYWDGLSNLVFRWTQREEYSHGFFIPLIAAWLLWQRREALIASLGRPSLLGVPLLLVALALLVLGELSAVFVLIHISIVILLLGLALLVGGPSFLKVAAIPLFFLLFAIPMPYFIDAQLSWGLQLVSSELGTAILRLMGVPVHLQGNLIDLGSYQLQVVEACSGLRYLYPLLSLGFLAAYLFSAPVWQRALVFLSVVPITVFMNSFRIAVIGVLVNTWGTQSAEGFLHFFEGWVIFMGCALLLLLEIWLLDRLNARRPIADLLAVPAVQPVPPRQPAGTRGWLPVSALALLLLVAVGVNVVGEREEQSPDRLVFSGFPLALGPWWGREGYLDPAIEEGLGLDDYFLADYRTLKGADVNLYMAWYASQRKGSSPHSPRVCIPAGGWLITELTRPTLDLEDSEPFSYNRAELELNDNRMLVYYWFEQRGRRMANEYWMKWYLLWDAIAINRTDGAMVRVTTPIIEGEPAGAADARLQSLLTLVLPGLPDFIPH
jgi:exosortase D (VPLPA-CTERM-specific)